MKKGVKDEIIICFGKGCLILKLFYENLSGFLKLERVFFKEASVF